MQKLLGGGSSFSAGGPGKGMHSRLYRAVLNQYYWMESAECVAQSFSNTGLFGIKASTKGGNMFPQLVEVVCMQLANMLYAPVHDRDSFQDELNRAKNQLKSSMFLNLVIAFALLCIFLFPFFIPTRWRYSYILFFLSCQEHRSILLDDIARQVAIYGHRYSAADLRQKIEAITVDDVLVRSFLGLDRILKTREYCSR